MELETTECIPISNKDREYTDCMEFSLLRCLQMMTYDPNKVEIVADELDNEDLYGKSYRSSYVPVVMENPLLKPFVEEFPTIYSSAEQYLENPYGVEQRAEWAGLVSDRGDAIDYYRNDEAELFTSVANIIKFFKLFFPVLDLKENESTVTVVVHNDDDDQTTPAESSEDSDDIEYDYYGAIAHERRMQQQEETRKQQIVLDRIAEAMTDFVNASIVNGKSQEDADKLKKKSISMNIKSVDIQPRQLRLSLIIAMISRPEGSTDDPLMDVSENVFGEYNAKYKENPNAEYEVITRHTKVLLTIDGYEYTWSLYEVYLGDEDRVGFKNYWITGHSVIYNR